MGKDKKDKKDKKKDKKDKKHKDDESEEEVTPPSEEESKKDKKDKKKDKKDKKKDKKDKKDKKKKDEEEDDDEETCEGGDEDRNLLTSVAGMVLHSGKKTDNTKSTEQDSSIALVGSIASSVIGAISPSLSGHGNPNAGNVAAPNPNVNVAELYKVKDDEPPLPPPTVTGTRRAVVIGINYIGHTSGQLKGCINDATNVENFLTTHGFQPQMIRKLTDDNPNAAPNKTNILAAMQWLVQGAAPGDSLFFHYSGHGGQEKDPLMLEEDGMNETIIPCDYQQSGQINDDTIHKVLVSSLPAGVRLTAIFDSCHSGTIMDLPYIYHATDEEYKNAHKAENSGFMHRHKIGFSSLKTFTVGGIGATLASVAGSEILYQGKKKGRQEILKQLNTSKAMVMQISGCRDEQTSADTNAFSGTSTGAMSYAFMHTMNQSTNQSWQSLIRNMRDVLHHGPKQFTQMPQLCMGRLVSPDLPVVF